MGIGKNKKLETNPIKFIWKYAKLLKWFAIMSMITTIISDVLSKFAVLYSSKTIDAISKYNGINRYEIKDNLIILIFIFCSIFFIKDIIIFINKYIEASMIPRFAAKAREDFFKSIHNKPVEFFNNNMSGEISSTGQSMIMGIEAIAWEFLVSIFPFIINMIVTIIFIYITNKEIALITFAIAISYIILMYFLGKSKTRYSKTYRKSYNQICGILTDSISNAVTVKNSANIKFETKNFNIKNTEVKNIYTKHRKMNCHVLSAQGFGNFLMTAILWIISLNYWLNNEISSVDFIFITGLITTSLSTLTFIIYAITGAMNSIGNIKNGLELLSQNYVVEDKEDAKELKISEGGLEIKNIDFQYKEKEINLFNQLNLEINSKEKVGIVGRSGSGKSTLIKLILRYFDTDKGDIIIDGQKIKDITQESLHKNIAIIPQEASLFNRSIMDNIRYGKVDASDDEVIEAAKKAFAHDFITETPNGYDSVVGEKGIKLSGGERQRIAIARAILKNSPILILDEATSALDSESEIFIQKSMNELMKDKTVIVIAHRLSTLKNMDRLVIMDKGEIIEVGSHNSLLRKKGIYHKLYSMQVDGFIGIEDGDVKKTG